MGDMDFSNKDITILKGYLSTSSSPNKDEQSAQSDKHRCDAQSELIKLIADIGTGIWRIHLGCSGAKDDPQRALNSILRNLESIWDIMAGRGIEIKDHTGETVCGGEALNIVAYQPSRDLTRDTVIETLRPTVYFQGRIIQIGEVIVGKPAKEMTSEE